MSKQTQRWKTLDVAKGLGLLAMAVTHSLVWWYVYPVNRLSEGDEMMFNGIFIAGGLGVMLLVFVAGGSLAFSWRRYLVYEKSHILLIDPKWQLARRVLLRSGLLYVVATAINVAVWGFAVTWYWNVLHFIALVQLVIYLAHRFGGMQLLGVLGVISLLSTYFFGLIAPLGKNGMVGEIFIGDLSSPHIWPLLPWCIVPLLGYVVILYKARLYQRRISKYISVAGLLLFVLGVFGGLFTLQIGYSFETIWDYAVVPPISFIVGSFGVFLFVTGLLNHCTLQSWIPSVLACMGQQVTIIYIIQLLVGFWWYVNAVPVIELTGEAHFLLGLIVQFILFMLVIMGRLYYEKTRHKLGVEQADGE